jgi:hypothetical protein
MTLELLIIGAVLLPILSFTFYINTKKKSKQICNISFKEAMDLTELPVVTFYNKGYKLNFLLDTGSNDSHINSSVLSNLSYRTSPVKRETTGMEGNRIQNDTCNMTISYKDRDFNTDFNVNDLDNAFSVVKQESGVQIHGILGSLFFQKYKYVLDFDTLIAYLK